MTDLHEGILEIFEEAQRWRWDGSIPTHLRATPRGLWKPRRGRPEIVTPIMLGGVYVPKTQRTRGLSSYERRKLKGRAA